MSKVNTESNLKADLRFRIGEWNREGVSFMFAAMCFDPSFPVRIFVNIVNDLVLHNNLLSPTHKWCFR